MLDEMGKYKAFERVKNLQPSGSGIEKKGEGQRGSVQQGSTELHNYWVTKTITAPNACESSQN